MGTTRPAFPYRALAAIYFASHLFLAPDMQAQSAEAAYGLEWPGDGAVRRMLYWYNPFPIYDATYIFQVYPRKKTSGAYRYYTTFFWGNDGAFGWDGGAGNTYYGAHPYPVPPPGGPGQWEISVHSADYVTGSEVGWDRWYTQAFRARRESASITHHEFYWDLPDTSKVISTTIVDAAWAHTNPPIPAIVMGQAPDLGGASWGGYPGWEEFNGIIRGLQFYAGVLSVADLLSEIAAPKSTTAGQSLMWYLNLDPRPGDVTDKKGIGAPHNPSWDGTTALEWIGDVSAPSTPTASAGGDGGGGGGGCFIATAAFGSPLTPQVQLLREVRDRYLLPYTAGWLAVQGYYAVSPPIADVISGSETLRAMVRLSLRPILGWAAMALWSPVIGAGIAALPVIAGILLLARRSRQR